LGENCGLQVTPLQRGEETTAKERSLLYNPTCEILGIGITKKGKNLISFSPGQKVVTGPYRGKKGGEKKTQHFARLDGEN